MRYSSDALRAHASPLIEIAMAAEQVPGAYRLFYGESDTATPEFICRAGYEAMREGHTFYTPTAGYAELREAIAAKVHELHGVSYTAEEVGCTVGAGMAIFLAIRSCVNSGDNVIIVSPAFSVFAFHHLLSPGDGSAGRDSRDQGRGTLHRRNT